MFQTEYLIPKMKTNQKILFWYKVNQLLLVVKNH